MQYQRANGQCSYVSLNPMFEPHHMDILDAAVSSARFQATYSLSACNGCHSPLAVSHVHMRGAEPTNRCVISVLLSIPEHPWASLGILGCPAFALGPGLFRCKKWRSCWAQALRLLGATAAHRASEAPLQWLGVVTTAKQIMGVQVPGVKSELELHVYTFAHMWIDVGSFVHPSIACRSLQSVARRRSRECIHFFIQTAWFSRRHKSKDAKSCSDVSWFRHLTLTHRHRALSCKQVSKPSVSDANQYPRCGLLLASDFVTFCNGTRQLPLSSLTNLGHFFKAFVWGPFNTSMCILSFWMIKCGLVRCAL